MIDLLSQHIETGARGFASVLLTVFPFLPASLETNPEQIMIVVGFAGQGLFAMRFIIQWLSSEKQAKSVIPVAFWYFSIGGGAVLLLYAIWRQDPVIICGQGRTPGAVLAEGRHTVAALADRARSIGIELPITDSVDKVVNHGHNLQQVVDTLLARRAGNE